MVSPSKPDIELLKQVERVMNQLTRDQVYPAGLGGIGGLPRIQPRSLEPSMLMGKWLQELLRRLVPKLKAQNPSLRALPGWELVRDSFSPFLVDGDLLDALNEPGFWSLSLPKPPQPDDTFLTMVNIAWSERALAAARNAASVSTSSQVVQGWARLALAVCGVCSIPLWTCFCGIQGTSTVQYVSVALRQVIYALGKHLDSHGLPDEILQGLRNMLQRKLTAVNAFDRWIDERPARTLPPEHREFLLAGTQDTPEANEIFWALPESWDITARLTALVGQAGFFLWVNAANNQFGGRHPPHQTHNTGYEIDLDWGLTRLPQDKVPNLKKGKLVDFTQISLVAGQDPLLYFSHFKNGKVMLLEPSAKNEARVTHFGLARLVSWCVYQSLPLAGYTRWLYSDSIGLRESFTHLIAALRLKSEEVRWDPGQMGSLSVIEPKGHFDHLHAEHKGKAPSYWTEKNIKILRELAIRRDDDAQFWEEMFSPSGIANVDRHLERVRHEWEERKSAGSHSLLPIWAPHLINDHKEG